MSQDRCVSFPQDGIAPDRTHLSLLQVCTLPLSHDTHQQHGSLRPLVCLRTLPFQTSLSVPFQFHPAGGTPKGRHAPSIYSTSRTCHPYVLLIARPCAPTQYLKLGQASLSWYLLPSLLMQESQAA